MPEDKADDGGHQDDEEDEGQEHGVLRAGGEGWDGRPGGTRSLPGPPRRAPTSLSIQVLPRQVAKQPKVPSRTTTTPVPTRTKGTLVAFSSSREK